MPNPLLQINGLQVGYTGYMGANKEPIISDLDFVVNHGEIVGIIGESGCGKSSLALSIANMLPYGIATQKGDILYNGESVLTMDKASIKKYLGTEVGFIFQDPTTALNPTIPIGKQIAERLKLSRNLNDEAIKKRVAEVIDEVGLPHDTNFLKKYPHELSGGERQRVMIAIAVIHSPKLIIADEPTTSLDPIVQSQILRLLYNIRKSYNCSIVLISHDFGVISQICDTTYVMCRGEFVESAAVDELFDHPAHPYTEYLLKFADISNFMAPDFFEFQQMNNKPIGAASCVYYNRCPIKEELCATKRPLCLPINAQHKVRCHLRGGNTHAAD